MKPSNTFASHRVLECHHFVESFPFTEQDDDRTSAEQKQFVESIVVTRHIKLSASLFELDNNNGRNGAFPDQSIMKSPRSILSPKWSGFCDLKGTTTGFGISFGGSAIAPELTLLP